jgi:DNA-binding beta-propeller fold protein YncE
MDPFRDLIFPRGKPGIGMRKTKTILMSLCLVAAAAIFGGTSLVQQVVEKDGVRVIHNVKGGKWGANPEVSLRLVRTLGGIEVTNENFAFHNPHDVAMDRGGNIYVLDQGNDRIQKFSPEGNYLATIGRRGQGPGEYEGPSCFDIDPEGYLYVFEASSRRIQVLTPAGKARQTIRNAEIIALTLRHLTSGLIAIAGFPNIALVEKKLQALPKLIRVLDSKGKLQFEFGDLHDFRNNLVNQNGNWVVGQFDKITFLGD